MTGPDRVALIVDDEPAERVGLARLVTQGQYQAVTAESAEKALDIVTHRSPAVVLTELALPDMDGIALVDELKWTPKPPAVVLVTGHATIESAVEAIRHGAADYLVKPVDPTVLPGVLERAIAEGPQGPAIDLAHEAIPDTPGAGPLGGRSPAMQAVFRWIDIAASSTAPVLVHGESGTGKELVARTIHARSGRKGPFIAVNCAAVPEGLFESEFFGHEPGAFTGASARRLGQVELAHGGTLFLDEIAELPAHQQSKMLRVLEGRSFRRVGGHEEIVVDLRVIAATNRDPQAAVAAGRLREDLFYRLNVLAVPLVPLRDRREDIVVLVQRFLKQLNRQEASLVRGLNREVLDRFLEFPWPGNVRELRNTTHLALVRCRSAGADVIGVEHLPPWTGGAPLPPPADDRQAASQGEPPPRRSQQVRLDRDVAREEVAGYYRAVAAAMLPFLAGRPMSLMRAPSTTAERNRASDVIYQWTSPAGLPAWIPTRRLRVPTGGGASAYLIGSDCPALLAVVALGYISLHPWTVTAEAPYRPDQLVIDLDAVDVPFREVRNAALLLGEVVTGCGLRAWVKTSGGSGLHFLVPLNPVHSYGDVRRAAAALAEMARVQDPRLFTRDVRRERRRGKILLDVSRNEPGATLISPYSMRADRALVSTPLKWEELAQPVYPDDFSPPVVLDRLRQGHDPFQDFLSRRQTLDALVKRGRRATRPPLPRTRGGTPCAT